MRIEKKNFIVTNDDRTRDVLIANGFTEVNDNSGCYVFVNEPKKFNKFSDENLKISFTNRLMF